MKLGITKLIAENIAPSNASKLAVFDGDTKVGTVDISKMQPSNLGEKLYSFGLVSDIHLNITDNYLDSNRFDTALTYFENQGCSFCCHAGDITNIGFWYDSSDTEMYTHQFNEYKRIRELHPDLPVYGCCGNHENYNKVITENLTELEYYTGYGLTFTITHGNDLFVFVGQPHGSKPMSDEGLQWLYETLEENRNKRCFVFIHPYISSADSGNPLGLHAQPIFDYWGATKTQSFTGLMAHYKNTMLFHGHSHIRPDVQLLVKNVNYSTRLGFRSFSLPSTAHCRTVVDGALTSDGTSFCYVADVYENCVVMKAYDILESELVPIAQYQIDTSLVYVEANTFTDSTGTITT